MIGGHDAHEHQEYLRDQRLVAEQADAQPARERQRPLPVVGAEREHVIHQMGGSAQSSGFATERDEDLVTARRAHDACEATFDDAAVEKPTEATLDVTRQPANDLDGFRALMTRGRSYLKERTQR